MLLLLCSLFPFECFCLSVCVCVCVVRVILVAVVVVLEKLCSFSPKIEIAITFAMVVRFAITIYVFGVPMQAHRYF